MKKKTLSFMATAAMTAAMSITAMAAGWQQNATGWWWQNDDGTWPANTWVWLDGNKDGVAECYYFDGNGYMAANTTTPDGYTVDANGAWTVNGAVQVQQTNTVTNNTSDNTRYTVIGGPTRVVPTNGLQGTYDFDRPHWNDLKNSAESGDVYFESYGEPSHLYTWYNYTENGETYRLGEDLPGGGVGLKKEGQWLIDNTKPDVENGISNVRYQYADGSFAGYGWHTVPVSEEYSKGLSWLYHNDANHQKYAGKASYMFSEDGYLYRNCYFNNFAAYGPTMVGYDGTWIDRMTF